MGTQVGGAAEARRAPARARVAAAGLAAVVSGLLMFAAFPPLSWTALAFVGWVPVVLAHFALASGGRASRALSGLAMGVLFLFLALSVNPPEVVTGWTWVGISLVVGLLVGALAGSLSLPGQMPALHARLGGWGFVWLPALTWTGLEYLRLITTFGNQWGMTAAAQIEVAPLRAYLPLAGMWPVTAITIATNYAIAGLALVLLGRAGGMRRAIAVSAASVAGAWALGLVLAALPTSAETGVLTVAAVQPGEHVPDHPATRPLIERAIYAPLTNVITELHAGPTIAAAKAGARLVVWPEASGWVDPHSPSAKRQMDAVRAVSRASGATIVWPYFIRIDRDRTRNELVLVRPDGSISAPTTKDHPVYVIGERSITAGLHPVYAVDSAGVGLAAGPDGSYTDTLRRLAERGAQLVAVPTHDWPAYAHTQLAHLRLRAAEHRIGVVKADWRSGSAVVGANGDLRVLTPPDRKTVALIVDRLPLTTPGTPYTASGDWLGVASLVVAGFGLLGTAAVRCGWKAPLSAVWGWRRRRP